MEEQGTGGDQTPFYSQFYDNPQQKQNVNGHPQQEQQQYNEIAPFNGENYNNLSAPFNGGSYNNVALPLNGESYINGAHYNNVSAPFNGENYNNVALPLNGESYINYDNYNNGLRHPLQLQSLPSSSHAPLAFCSSHHDIVHNNNNNHYLYPQAQIQMHQAQIQMHQAQLQMLQQTQIQRQIQQQEQQTSKEMHFRLRQNMEMDIQQIQLQQQQQHMDQSKNVNVNVISQSMETVVASVTPPNGEKRKRGRPRNSSKNADIGPSTPPLSSAKTPQGLQFESGGAGLFQVIVIIPGEDVYEKIMAFCQHTPFTVCIISANGTVSDVYFHEILFGRIVKHKGEFEILSLSHSYTMDNNGLHVTLINPDGRIFRGPVAGLLMAASHVEVVVGVFPLYPRGTYPRTS